MVYPCVVIDLRATLACQDSDPVFYTIEITGIYILEILSAEVVACLLVETYWGVCPIFRV